MIRYNPKIDLVFRKLFGSEENKDILISLLNGILDQKPHITDLTIKNPYNLATYVGGKTSILDIKAVDDKNTLYDIELQVGEQGSYGRRALYYLSKVYVDQMEESGEYSSLNKTIGIHLIDFDYFPDETRYKRHFVYKDMETNEIVEGLSYQQLYFIELKKFKKDWNEINTLLDRWVAFLNKAHSIDKKNMPEQMKKEKELIRAFEKLEEMNFSKEEREIYEAEQKKRWDTNEEVVTALKKGMEEGTAKGREEGMKEGTAKGREEGMKEGIRKGREEAKFETARNALESGIQIEKVAEFTQIDIETLKRVIGKGKTEKM